MREILFRGKRIDNGEWVYGHYGEYIRFEKPISAISIPSDDSFMGNLCYDVDPSTVGQYTGLTANGKKIFEGDIVKVEKNDHDWHEHDPNSYSIFAVDFDEGGYTAGDYFLQNWLWFDGFHGEVIGNIYDNPELLDNSELLEAEK
jgi:uncharacterized phage protein (TIGR01671 family)